jgi:cyclin-dependent kinase 7
VTALREVKLLRELSSLSCPYIITLLDVFPLKKNLALVFDLMEGDLEAIIKDRSLILSTADIKSYMKMLLTALDVCHRSFVVHRDVKPNNLLVSSSGEIKLSDFGLSRLIGSPERGSGGQRRPYTNQVFARWYRSPELLYGSTLYGFACDIWAAGQTLKHPSSYYHVSNQNPSDY